MEKSERLRSLFLIREFGDFLSLKRNQNDLMVADSAYNLLFKSLSDDDVLELEKLKVRFGLVIAPASQISLNVGEGVINLICFEKHFFRHFTKEETVAVILHEIGHAVNPDLKGDEGEFRADDYAVNRNYRASIISSLSKARELNLPGFDKEINHRRINRLQENG